MSHSFSSSYDAISFDSRYDSFGHEQKLVCLRILWQVDLSNIPSACQLANSVWHVMRLVAKTIAICPIYRSIKKTFSRCLTNRDHSLICLNLLRVKRQGEQVREKNMKTEAEINRRNKICFAGVAHWMIKYSNFESKLRFEKVRDYTEKNDQHWLQLLQIPFVGQHNSPVLTCNITNLKPR